MSLAFQIPNFSLVRELGAGGPTPVFLAEQTGLERQAAVRILCCGHSGLGPDLRQAFERESRLLARVQHRNIVRIYQIGATDSVLFRAMEYLEGGSLLDRMRANDMTPLQAANCCAQLAQALQAVHALGAFHHDLRPSSILFRDARTPVLTDLGMVRASTLDRSDTVTGINQRTPRYLSPEQSKGHAADARSDVFALGLLLHFMLTGKFPGHGQEPAATDMSRIVEQLEPLPADVASLQPVLVRMLAGIPEQRYQDLQQCHTALATAMPLPHEPAAVPLTVPLSGPLRRKPRHVLALSSGPVLLAAALVLWQWLPRGLDEAEVRRVEQELQAFETYMTRMQIYGPTGTNATASLEQLLALAGNYPEVGAAAHRLADIYLQDAYQSYLRKNFEDVLRLTSKGLEFAPGHPQLGQLQVEASQALTAINVQNLLAQGESALAQENLLPPMAGNAFSIFMEVKSLDPGNQAADSGLREIQLRIAEQVRVKWGSEGLDPAYAVATENLLRFPDSVLLKDLMADLEHARQAD